VALEPAEGLVLLDERPPRRVDIDVLFPLVHGWGGEDGRLQGALELAGVPYVGPGVLGSAAAMDKAMAKILFQAAGLPVVPWLTFSREAHVKAPRDAARQVEDRLGYPVFVKPANGGSSVGVSRATGPQQLAEAMELAFDCDRKLLVEAAVNAREIECAVLGNDEPRASVLGEIFPSREFYDYAAKYLDGTSRLAIPAELDGSTTETIRTHALRAFEALDLSGLARVDFLVDRDSGQGYVNEVNTLPGFTPISMFPKLWEASGVAYPALIETLVRLAQERVAAEGRRRTRWDQTPSGPA
jgi:D-alanine-D-alanine ligase